MLKRNLAFACSGLILTGLLMYLDGTSVGTLLISLPVSVLAIFLTLLLAERHRQRAARQGDRVENKRNVVLLAIGMLTGSAYMYLQGGVTLKLLAALLFVSAMYSLGSLPETAKPAEPPSSAG